MVVLTILFLAFMEVSLSFDNAIINAGVLRNMAPIWRHRFITWGMPVAIFGMRFLFPVLIVCIVTNLTISETVRLAISSPEQYSAALASVRGSIDIFGGMFLLMIFLKFVCEGKDIYWLRPIEEKLANLGKLESIEIAIALSALAVISHYGQNIFIYGASGVILYILINSFMGERGNIKSGLSAFIYLEILDASCSFDGVIGAFVLTNNILYIMAGLGLGALAVRSLTLYLVKGGVLKEFIYLEHGAHYAIGTLAVIMLTDIFYPVPEPITGMIGMSLIGLSLVSSILHFKKQKDSTR